METKKRKPFSFGLNATEFGSLTTPPAVYPSWFDITFYVAPNSISSDFLRQVEIGREAWCGVGAGADTRQPWCRGSPRENTAETKTGPGIEKGSGPKALAVLVTRSQRSGSRKQTVLSS